MKIEKYSFGVGDRFRKEGAAQLKAIQAVAEKGFDIVPVWNKSFREHSIVKTDQSSVRAEADHAVKANGWKGNYYVDADHIGLITVDGFMAHSDFFTIDVADFIGEPANVEDRKAFIEQYREYLGTLTIPGIAEPFMVTTDFLQSFADTFLVAIQHVFLIYEKIVQAKGRDGFIPEVSMDECAIAQSPLELFFILAELKRIGVEVQTIAPKFTGLFPKGVDYVGDVQQFAKEFEQDVAVTQFAIKELGLPDSLKLSVHSGSDKFSIYPAMAEAIRKFDAGIHVKTAGTTWLEEVIGLAQGGGEGLAIAREVYSKALDRFDELTGPYATVLNIDEAQLPSAEEVGGWDARQFSDALTHDQSCEAFNASFRQLIHVGYKIAVEMGDRFTNALDTYREVIEKNVTYNLQVRHLGLLFNSKTT